MTDTVGTVGTAARTRWIGLYVASAIAGFLLLDISKANVALPQIADALYAGPTTLQLVSAGYVVAFGLTLIPFGRLGDQGHRRVLALAGLALYAGSSALSALASHAWILVTGRVLLGVAAGILMPQVMGIIQQLFSGEERGRAFASYGVAVAVATALGPSLGGLLVTVGGPQHGWRLVFAMNVPFGLALFVLARRVLGPQPAVSGPRAGFDPGGSVLLAGTLLFVLSPIVATTGRDDDPDRWAWLVPAALLGVAFWWWERRHARGGGTPLIDGALLGTPSYRTGLLVGMTWLACGPGAMIALVLYAQLGLGMSPLLSAVILLPASLSSAVGAWWAGPRVLRAGRRITLLGILISITGMALTLVAALALPPSVAAWGIGAAELAVGLGNGMIISPNHVLMLADVPAAKGSLAASMAHLGQRIGNSVGIAAVSASFFAVVYGPTGRLAGASAATYDQALIAAYAVAGVFVVLALWLIRPRRGEP